MSFPTAEISEVGKIVTGTTPKAANKSAFGGEIPFVTPSDLDQDGVILSTQRHITEIGAKECKLLPKNSILVSCIGTLGKVSIAGKKLATNQQINAIIFDEEKVFPKYGFYACRRLKPLMDLIAPSTTLPILNKTKFSNLKIPLPSLSEQKRIAAILDQADALRQKRQQALDHLNQLGQSIFYEMFGDEIRNGDPKVWPGLKSLLSEKLRSGAYYPKEDYSETGTEMVHMSDAFYDLVFRGNLKRVICPPTDLEKYSLNRNDLLIARRSLVFEGAAKPCMIPRSEEPLIFESSFIRVRPDITKVVTEYLFYYLNLEEIKERFVRPFVTRSTISGINQTNLGDVKIMLPSVDAQNVFCEKIQKLSQIKEQHISLDREFVSLFSSLQQRAFKGEL